ncbi:MFS transporter [Halorarum halophilum]|uniref:MFS transporter n=1 Tax=Halorarum halophilum TaxID=2743090 RepID=A0A7D5GHE2_9EURY|nr:MFS transporter [Halobaculum halophilum]QLG27471.1 MFS transporter [Halobaculum halophilum]
MSSLRSAVANVSRETALVIGLVSGSHVLNHMYLVLFPPILGILAADFDVTLAQLGFAIGVQAFVNTVFQLPYGYLADTRDRTLALGLCLGVGSLGVLVIAAAPSFEWVVAGQALIGLGVAGHHPSHFPLLADATPESTRARAFSVHGFAGNLGFAIPPVLITAVIALPGLTWRDAFALIGGVGLALGVLCIVALRLFVSASVRRPHREADDRTAASIGSRVRAGVDSILAAPGILGLGVFALVASTVMWGVTTYVVVLLTDGYGLGNGTANLALSASFVVGAGFVLVGGDLTDRFRPGPILIGSYLLVATFVFALASMVVPPLAAAVCAVLAGSVGSLAMPARDKLADALSARGDVGRNFAVITVGIMIGNAVAAPLFGTLIETNGLRTTFGTVGAFAVLSVVLVGALVSRVDPDGTDATTA